MYLVYKYKQYNNFPFVAFQVKDKMYTAAHWVSTHSLPPEAGGSPAHEPGRHGQPDRLGDRVRGKKEVSFSLDEEMEKMAGDADTSGSMGSVFASQHGGSSDNNNLVSVKYIVPFCAMCVLIFIW
jgi:hypothetical protein